MTKGYNLPDDTSPNDPDAPWNKTGDAEGGEAEANDEAEQECQGWEPSEANPEEECRWLLLSGRCGNPCQPNFLKRCTEL